MPNFQLNSILASQLNKVLINSTELSIAGVSAAKANVMYLMDGNLACSALRVSVDCMYGDITTTAPFNFFVDLNLVHLASTDNAVVEAEINKFLNTMQIEWLSHAHVAESFLDEEYESLEQIYPNLSVIDFDIADFENVPFKVVESTDNMTSTAFGFVNETMYFFTDVLIPKVIFTTVRQFNSESNLEAFTHNAQLPVNI